VRASHCLPVSMINSQKQNVQYAPVPQVDYEQESPHKELGSTDFGHKPANGHPSHPPARSWGNQHISGHKDFATFSAHPVRDKGDSDSRADPSFLHYVALAMSLTASSTAAFGVPKVMAFSIPGWLDSLKMSRTTLSASISVANLAGALVQPYIGRCVDRFGPRFALAGMLALLSVAFTAPSFAVDMESVFLRAAVMASAIFGIRSLQAGIDTAGNVLVNHWFLKLRGRVSSTRQVVYLSVQDLVLVQIVQGIDDWQATCWLSAAVAVCSVCVMLLGVTDTPEEVQLRPDGGRLDVGDAETGVDGKRGTALKVPGKKEGGGTGVVSFTLKEARNTSSFWILLFNNVLYSSIGPTTTLLLLDIVLDSVGGSQTKLKAIDVATCLYLPHFVVAAVVGPVTGWMIDYGIEVKHILCYSNMCLAVSTALATNITSPVTAGLFGAMRGNVGGTRQAVKQTVWANYYGRGHLGEITGISRTCEMLGMAMGPLLLGWSREYYGQYRTGCLLMAVGAAGLSLSMLMLTKPIHPSLQEGATGAQGVQRGANETDSYQAHELNHPCRMEGVGANEKDG
jgi:MFS family permease